MTKTLVEKDLSVVINGSYTEPNSGANLWGFVDCAEQFDLTTTEGCDQAETAILDLIAEDPAAFLDDLGLQIYFEIE